MQANISRRQLIKRGAVVGGAALWVPPVVQSMRLPAYAAVGSPPPVTCIVDGWMTGGGFIDVAGVRVKYDLRKFDCPPLTSPPELKVSWTTGSGKNQTTYDFELLTYTSRICSDNPNIPNGPNADFDTAIGTGDGSLTIDGVQQNATLEFGFVDGGEGNGATDTVTLIIKDAGNNTVMSIVNLLVNGGNLQGHDGNFAEGQACA